MGAGTVLKTNAIDREERVMITGHNRRSSAPR
nr:MAG TPA: hypothetical protein [Caudoviricetes sp.]